MQADAVYGASPADLELTTAWGVDASYMHFWNKKWQTSVYGSYVEIDYDSTANAAICASFGTNAISGTCNNSFSYWDIGTETIFNLDANTYVGLDVVYQNLNSANAGDVIWLAPGNGKTTGAYSVTDQSAWTVQFRVHRNFYP